MTHQPTNENGHTSPPHVRLQLLSQPMYLAGARELCSAIAKRFGFDDLSCSQIALAVDESLANIMRHGYLDRTDGLIWISVWPITQENSDTSNQPVGIRILIDDEAAQVEPDCICGRDLEDIKPGGLGVHIIRHVMDHCCYEKRNGVGMRLTLEKRIANGSPAASA